MEGQRERAEGIKDLFVKRDYNALMDAIASNDPKDIEIKVYARRGTNFAVFEEVFKRMGIEVVVEEEDRNEVVVLLKNHLRFIAVKIRSEK